MKVFIHQLEIIEEEIINLDAAEKMMLFTSHTFGE